MNVKNIFGFMTVAAVAFSTLASASTTTPLVNREEFTVGKGDIQTTFFMIPTLLRGDANTTIVNLGIGANYFMTDMLAPGVEFDYVHLAGGDSAQFLPNLKAYWPLHSKVLPYVQVGLGYAHSAGTDLFDLRIAPGIDYLLANNVAIGFAFRYDLGVGNITVHKIEFPLQFAIYFKL